MRSRERYSNALRASRAGSPGPKVSTSMGPEKPASRRRLKPAEAMSPAAVSGASFAHGRVKAPRPPGPQSHLHLSPPLDSSGYKAIVGHVNLQAPRGTRDLLPRDLARWEWVEREVEAVFCAYGFKHVRTPVFEKAELFARSLGEETDIVSKEMYVFRTKGGDEFALRPENTAGIVRAFLERGLHRTEGRGRFYYLGPMFRHESAQKKRYRQFWQAGVELLGSGSPEADVEVIACAYDVFSALGLEGVTIDLSSFGCRECRRPFREGLLSYYEPKGDSLCPVCRERLGRNVFRLLDCKEERCRRMSESAPKMLEFLDDGCREHFGKVKSGLGALGVPFELNPLLVRGLDYYDRTVFEVFFKSFGRQDALGAGGRYDGLSEMLGGPPVAAVGFALGLDRIVLACEEEGKGPAEPERLDVFFCPLDGEARVICARWMRELRIRRVSCISDPEPRRLKAFLRRASKERAYLAVIVGEDERARERAVVRDMDDGKQTELAFEGLVDDLAHLLRRGRP